MAKGRDKIILCEGVSKDGKAVCPLREGCAFFCQGFNKSKTDHFAWCPYNFSANHCDEFEQRDVDTIIRNSINKNPN